MPSGLTSDIYEGKDPSLRSYLMGVGRQYGFALMQRDEPIDAEIRLPRRRRPDEGYHGQMQTEALATLTRISGMSDAEATLASCEAHAEAAVRRIENRSKAVLLRMRYEAMIRRVEGWEPPSFAPQIKDGAIKYLRESIDFDCGWLDRPAVTRYDAPQPLLSGPEWKEQQRENALRDLEYAADRIIEDLEREDGRDDAILEFLMSLPPETA